MGEKLMNKKSFFGGMTAGIALIAVVGLFSIKVIMASPKSMLEDVFPNSSTRIESKISAIVDTLEKTFIDDIDEKTLEEGIYQGIANSLGDKYTTYMSADVMKEFNDDNNGVFDGVGVEATLDYRANTITIVSAISGTPADKAGLTTGDMILKVDNEAVEDLGLGVAMKNIKGERGTDVVLTIYRPSEDKTFNVTLERAEIDSESVSGRMLEGNIGYISISQFSGNTYDQFKKFYDDFNNQGQKGLIIDLRSNPGGLLDIAAKITDLLTPKGTLVYTIDKNDKKWEYPSDATAIKIPLVLLVNEGSASASEIMAGAVQDLGAGKLVGTQTFGKGIVQSIYSFSDGSGLKVTTSRYYTPNGVCIHGTGITPDYIVELSDEAKLKLVIEEDEDVQFQKAVEVIKEQLK